MKSNNLEWKDKIWVHFVGAGCGAKDLITVRGARLLEQADVVIYAGSLVNPELLEYCPEAEIHNSAFMTLEEVLDVMEQAVSRKKQVVRLHTGDPSVYGAIREQMDALDEVYKTHGANSACRRVLITLLNDLKKLKGE